MSPAACSWICFGSCLAHSCVLLPQTPGSEPSFSSEDWRKLSGSPNHSQDTPAQFPCAPRVCLLLGSAKVPPASRSMCLSHACNFPCQQKGESKVSCLLKSGCSIRCVQLSTIPTPSSCVPEMPEFLLTSFFDWSMFPYQCSVNFYCYITTFKKVRISL